MLNKTKRSYDVDDTTDNWALLSMLRKMSTKGKESGVLHALSIFPVGVRWCFGTIKIFFLSFYS